MTEAEFNAQVEAELNAQIEAELQVEMARKRFEIARRLRREAEMKEYDRINARHPIQGPGDPKVEAERRAAMDERAREVSWRLQNRWGRTGSLTAWTRTHSLSSLPSTHSAFIPTTAPTPLS